MMNEVIISILMLLGGAATGVVFFGGLWFTVQKAIASNKPALWFIGSFIIRLTVTLAGFYFLSGGKWPRLLICVAGFLIARIIVTRLTRNKKLKLTKEEVYEVKS
ncbi:MAG TPA: ATP synthase subunit I [Agriterribacter sp.]|nr:ATP synthase subunit I [Agriterribacter sp.]